MQGSDNKTPSRKADAALLQQEAQQEKRRQAYLEAMGIQTWYPRCQLPNAAPPRPFDWILEDASEFIQQQPVAGHTYKVTDSQAAAKTTRQTEYSPTRAADILGQFVSASEPPETAPEPVTTEPEDKAPQTRQHSQPAAPFRLIIEPAGDDCLVVAEMPHSGLNQFSRFHQRLLNDILRALKLPSSTSPEPREFVWPISQNRGLLSQLSQDNQAAADAVKAFLNNQYGLSRQKIILLLGQAAARFIIDPAQNFESLRGIRQSTSSQQWFAISHGLNELMKQPSLKAEAWQDLAPLHATISAATH